MEVLLDSSFILSCVKKGIDFMSQLEEQGFIVKVPSEVIDELKDLRLETRHVEREAIAVALAIFENRNVKKMKLGKRKVDEGLIEHGKKGYYIATLDRDIKRRIPHAVVIFDAQKKVGVES